MRPSPAIAALAVVLAVMPFVACESANHYLGTCEETVDCRTQRNNQPAGSVCNEQSGLCECLKGKVPCCPYEPPGECVDADVCLPFDRARCNASVNDPPLNQTCIANEDCPQPPSNACGRGTCVSGKCELTIEIGPLESQKWGDCFRGECNEKGELVEIGDDLDYYDDANGCTIDFCQGGKSINLPLPDASPCSQPKGQGYCYQTQCVECIQSMAGASCDGNGIVCTKFWCEPFAQCSNSDCGGECAPCGAGSPCGKGEDCVSESCQNGMCAIPTCSDGARNGLETDIDCGGADCTPCPAGEDCALPKDCASKVCKKGTCAAPLCTDGTMNGEETATDCGGSCDPC